MLFSVVICTYNRADQVHIAVDTVLAQTLDDFELVVVNDGSADHTAEVLAAYDDPHLKVIHRPNGGLSAARNTGINQAQGRFVAFLDDDDEVSPRWLEGLAAGIDDTTGFTACTWNIAYQDPPATFEVAARAHVLFPDIRGGFASGCFAIEHSILDEIGGYAEEIRVSHQSELLLRALTVLKDRGMTAALIEEPLVTIERRRPENRPLSQPAELLHGAEYLIAHHRNRLADRPAALANYFAIAGVSAAQLGDFRTARRHLGRAALMCPRRPKHLARFAVSLITPLARHTWRLPS
jgi:glycosyltransferase involved in cell wall biosynthesis